MLPISLTFYPTISTYCIQFLQTLKAVPGLRAGRMRILGSNPGRGDVFPLQNVQTSSRAHPGSYSVGTRVLSPAVNRPEREVDHFHLVRG